MVIATDEGYENAFDRILNKELGGVKVQEDSVYIGGKPLLQNTERGRRSITPLGYYFRSDQKRQFLLC